MDVTDVVNEISRNEGFERGGGTSKETIRQVENSLGLELPDEYIQLLIGYGYISWFGGEIFGVSEDSYFDVVERTISAREEELPSDYLQIPTDTVVLCQYGGGGYYLLYSKESNRNGAVSLVTDESFYTEEDCWPSLVEFLSEIGDG